MASFSRGSALPCSIAGNIGMTTQARRDRSHSKQPYTRPADRVSAKSIHRPGCKNTRSN